jgi:hypothetical protein
MESSQAPQRSVTSRVIELAALVMALLGSFVAGTWYSQSKLSPAPERAMPSVDPYDTTKGFPQPDTPRPADPKKDEPYAVATRVRAIRSDADAIAAECQKAAGGDWDKWEHDTASYRSALKARVEKLKLLNADHPEESPNKYEALAGKANFPLFEVGAHNRLTYLYDPDSLDSFRKEQPVVAAHRWLRERGIDVIFVPVPKMTAVYIEHFLDSTPPDGVIAPHVRRVLYELLQNDVEVIDAFRIFRRLREVDNEYLYSTADTHWAPHGMRIIAKQIADRIERYQFGARAKYALPIYKTALGPYGLATYRQEYDKLLPLQDGWVSISLAQQQLAAAAQTTTNVIVTTPDGKLMTNDPKSPVILMGHSYVQYFVDQLFKELNIRTQTYWSGNTTTQVFGDFLREPELLANCRVVVWITTEQHMTNFHPMPTPISALSKK